LAALATLAAFDRRGAARVAGRPGLRSNIPMRITRRRLLVRAAQAGAVLSGAAGVGVGYGFWEAAHVRVARRTVPVPNLPPAFDGATVAVLADLHHGPFVGLPFVRRVVELANGLNPDLVALVGDYAHRGKDCLAQLGPCLEALSGLRAPLGAFAVPGNHDMHDAGRLYHKLVADTPLADLTNRNRPVERDGQRLWLAGVDDLWWGKPDVKRALAGVPAGEAVVLLCHNPDFAESAPNSRVGLMLSGHTHGGQVYVPEVGRLWVPSRYGDKYRAGLVEGPASRVFVSRGLGEAGVPVRVGSPPEVNLLTLTAG
jgi:predicted MPP superfamily phosphohydrolase